jgi:hypothetical protein
LSGSGSKTATPAGFMSLPMPNVNYQGQRIASHGQNLAPGAYRPTYPSVSPVYASNGGPSPAPIRSSFPEPSSSPFDMRSAPIGMGFPPQQKSRPAPIGSMDELSPTHMGSRVLSGGSSDLPSQLNALSLMHESSLSSNGLSHGPSHVTSGQSYHLAPGPAPIGPPKAAPQPIGRPSYHENHLASGANRPRSPVRSDQVLGSAALGSDDDVVVSHTKRNTSNQWDMPPHTAAPGGGISNRWSTAPTASIWNSTANDHSHIGPLGAAPVQSHWSQTPFSAPPPIGQQTRQNSLGSGLGGGPFGAGPGNGPFGSGLNLFSTPHPTNNPNHHPSNANAASQHNQHH